MFLLDGNLGWEIFDDFQRILDPVRQEYVLQLLCAVYQVVLVEGIFGQVKDILSCGFFCNLLKILDLELCLPVLCSAASPKCHSQSGQGAIAQEFAVESFILGLYQEANRPTPNIQLLLWYLRGRCSVSRLSKIVP